MMQPEEQKQPDSPSYDFIFKTETPEEPPLFQRLNKKRLVIFLAVLLVLLTGFLVVASKLQARANAAQKERLIELVQMQTEIRRIASIGEERAEQKEVQVRAQAIKDSMDNSLAETKSLLEARKGVIDDQLLDGNKNEKTDEQLDKSEEFKSFDRTFNKAIDVSVLNYQKALIIAERAGNSREKAVLHTEYSEANSILGLVDER